MRKKQPGKIHKDALGDTLRLRNFCCGEKRRLTDVLFDDKIEQESDEDSDLRVIGMRRGKMLFEILKRAGNQKEDSAGKESGKWQVYP